MHVDVGMNGSESRAPQPRIEARVNDVLAVDRVPEALKCLIISSV